MHGKLFQSFSNSLFTKVETFCEKSFLSRLFKLYYRWLKNEISRVTKIVYMFVKKKRFFKTRKPLLEQNGLHFLILYGTVKLYIKFSTRRKTFIMLVKS